MVKNQGKLSNLSSLLQVPICSQFSCVLRRQLLRIVADASAEHDAADKSRQNPPAICSQPSTKMLLLEPLYPYNPKISAYSKWQSFMTLSYCVGLVYFFTVDTLHTCSYLCCTMPRIYTLATLNLIAEIMFNRVLLFSTCQL